MEITLLKLNVDGSTFTPNAPFSNDSVVEGGDEEAGTGVRVGEDTRGESGGRSKVPLLAAVVGLVFLLGAAFAARRYLSEDGADGTDVEIAEAVPSRD
jgi:hypothetical protein